MFCGRVQVILFCPLLADGSFVLHPTFVDVLVSVMVMLIVDKEVCIKPSLHTRVYMVPPPYASYVIVYRANPNSWHADFSLSLLKLCIHIHTYVCMYLHVRVFLSRENTVWRE